MTHVSVLVSVDEFKKETSRLFWRLGRRREKIAIPERLEISAEIIKSFVPLA
jgi:hypothetical protein